MTRLLATTAVLLALTGEVSATPLACLPAKELAAALATKYAEAPVAFGIQNDGNLLSVYAGEDSWTVVMTSPATGKSCIVTAGEGPWHALEAVKGEGV